MMGLGTAITDAGKLVPPCESAMTIHVDMIEAMASSDEMELARRVGIAAAEARAEAEFDAVDIDTSRITIPCRTCGAWAEVLTDNYSGRGPAYRVGITSCVEPDHDAGILEDARIAYENWCASQEMPPFDDALAASIDARGGV